MGFKRELRMVDIWALALGSIIGWGCFVLPGTAFLPKAGPLGAILGLCIGAVIVSIVGINYGYLIEKYPKAGGEFVYAHKNFGKTIGYICGWFLLLAYISIVPLNATAIGLAFRFVFGDVMQVGYLYSVAGWDVYIGEVVIAVLFLVVFAILNSKGVRNSGLLQTFIVFVLSASIVLLTIGVFVIHQPDTSNLSPAFAPNQSNVTSVLAVLAMAPWAFSGFDCIPQAAEEFNFPNRKARYLLFASIICAVIMLSAVILITASVFPWSDFIAGNPEWATGQAVQTSLGTVGMGILLVAMLCAVISGINGFYLSSSRLIYSIASEGQLPSSFSKISKNGTPKNALIFVLAVSLTAPFFGREVLGWIVDMCSVGISAAYLITSLSAFKQGRADGLVKYQVSGILGSLVSAGFLVLLLVPGMPGFLSTPSLVALGIWVVLGLIFFIVARRKK